jgi:hypothetical protein
MADAQKFKEIITKHVVEMEREFSEYKDHINRAYVITDDNP